MAAGNDWVELTHTTDSKVLWVKPDKVDMVMVRKERPDDQKNQDYIVLFQLNGFDGEYAMEESLRKPYKSQEAAREWVRRFLMRNSTFLTGTN
jgi:hypothetical protein